MKILARIVASKWFAGPLCTLPALYLAWEYAEAMRRLSAEPEPAILHIVAEDANATDANASSQGVEYADFVFTVSEEEFHEATGGMYRQKETNATGGEGAEDENDGSDGFSFTVTDEQFETATETLQVAEGEDVYEAVAEGATDANPNERLLREAGDIAIAFFLIILCFTPLKRLLPRSLLVSAINRHRRLVGLCAFFYACLHFLLYFVDDRSLFEDWSKIYILAGLTGFSTLAVLAATSNDRIVRKLGGKRWKNLHRLLYLAIPVLFYHKGWTGKAPPDQIRETVFWFAPLLLLQATRIAKLLRRKSS